MRAEDGQMLKIGCHLSLSHGYLAMGETANSIGADTFAFFTRNPRGGKARLVDPDDLGALQALTAAKDFAPLVAHAPYTLNLCSDKPDVRQFAEETMAEDLALLEHLPGNYYNFHPGCHMKQGRDAGIELISSALNRIMKPECHTRMLLETMAGKGTEIGRTFEELRDILLSLDDPDHFGVCLDTCHVFDAGYDIVHSLDAVISEFDRVIGLSSLYAIHLNDSKNELGSHKDRHEKIGKGHIGLPAITAIIRHPALRDLPFILETPNELEGYQEEIEMLKSLANTEEA